MNNPEFVTIPAVEYAELVERSAFLRALENNGVDNWDYYDDAIEDFNRQVIDE